MRFKTGYQQRKSVKLKADTLKRSTKLISLQPHWKRREWAHTNIRNERRDITIGTMDIKRIINEYYEQLYGHKFHNPVEMDQLLERHNFLKLTEVGLCLLNVLINNL